MVKLLPAPNGASITVIRPSRMDVQISVNCIDLLILFVEEGLESKAMTIGSGIYISFATLIESVWGSCADPNAARGPQCDIFIAIEESPLKLLEVQYSNVGFLRISDMLCIKLSLRDKPL